MLDPKVLKAIKKLEDDAGVVEPQRIVEAAKSKTSPLHTYFEWDVSVAANRHWVDQARDLLQRYRLEVVYEDREINVPHYVHDVSQAQGAQGYIPTLQVKKENVSETLLQALYPSLSHLTRAVGIAAVHKKKLPKGYYKKLTNVETQIQDVIDTLLNGASKKQSGRKAG